MFLEHLEPRALLSISLASAHAFGGPDWDASNGVAIDAHGNSYHIGQFSGTIDLDPGPGEFKVSSPRDPSSTSARSSTFVSKFDRHGKFIWGRRLKSALDKVLANDIAVTPRGQVFVTGRISIGEHGDEKIFLTKLNNSGVLWTLKPSMQQEAGMGTAVVTDASGDVYVAGTFSGGLDFNSDGVPELQNFEGNLQNFIAKLDTKGNLIWARAFGGSGSNSPGLDIAIDRFGSVYATGSFFDAIDLDPGPADFTLTPADDQRDAYVLKLDSSGNFVWARSFHRASGTEIKVDYEGNAYTTGIFDGISDFDPGPAVFNLTTEPGFRDAYVSKLSSAGQFVWAVRASDGPIHASHSSIALNGFGDIFLTAQFSGEANFNQRPGGCTAILRGTDALFVLKLDSEARYLDVKQIAGDGLIYVNDIVANSMGDISLTGEFDYSADFDPDPTKHKLSSVGSYDIFFLQLYDNTPRSFLGGISPNMAARRTRDIVRDIQALGFSHKRIRALVAQITVARGQLRAKAVPEAIESLREVEDQVQRKSDAQSACTDRAPFERMIAKIKYLRERLHP